MTDSVYEFGKECGKIFVLSNDNFTFICKFCGDDFHKFHNFRVHLTVHFRESPLFIECEETVTGENDYESFPLDMHFSETLANIKNEDSISCGSENESSSTDTQDEYSDSTELVDYHQLNVKTIGNNEIPTTNDLPESDIRSVLHTGRKRGFECRFCCKMSTSRKQCYDHELVHMDTDQRHHTDKRNHTDKRLQCLMCEKKFSNKYKLDNHTRVNHQFTDPLSIRDHMNINISTFECRFCRKPFVNSSTLNNHERGHHCKISSKTTTPMDSLSHVKLRTGDHSYAKGNSIFL